MERERPTGDPSDGGAAARPERSTRLLDEAELVGILAALRIAGAAMERALVAANRLRPGTIA